jgi:hypothetical protein
MMRLDKDATPLNKDYEKLRRGSIVTFDRAKDEEKRYKVGKETAVSLFSAPLNTTMPLER